MLAIVALMLLGQQADRPTNGPSMIRYEVRFLDLHGILWRNTMVEKLKTLETDDGNLAWLTDSVTVVELELKARADHEKTAPNPPEAEDDRKSRPEAPTISAQAGAKAEIHSHQVVRYVAGVNAVRSNETNEVIGFQPIIAKLNDGCAVSLAGTPTDSGIKLRLKIDENRIQWFSTLEAKSANGLSAQYSVPQMLRGRAEGEWIVPDGQTLLISLGPYTVDDDDDKAVSRERLVAISAKKVTPDELTAPQTRPVTSAR